MGQDKIQLTEARRIGDVAGDSIQFIKQNFKDIAKNIVLVFLPFFILSGTLLSMRHFQSFKNNANFLAVTGVLLTFVVATLFHGLICEYIVLYVKNGNTAPSLDSLLKALKKDSFIIIITTILNLVFLALAFLMLFIPGIYMMIPLSLILIIRLQEKSGYFAALDKSFRLTAGNWWKSLGLYLIFGIMMLLFAVILYLPYIIFNQLGSLHNKDIQESTSLVMPVVLEFMNQLFNILYIFPIIGSAFLYFSLVEQKDGTGLRDKIKKLRDKHENVF